MKKLLYFLLFLFIGTYCYSQETDKLSTNIWEEIVEMNSHKYTPITKWANDVNVGLEGLYIEADSLIISKIVKKLDALTETISIKFSSAEDSNLKMIFLDTLVKTSNNFNNTLTGRFGPNYGEGYTSGEVYIYKIDKTNAEIQKTLESRLVRTLVNGSFRLPMKEERRNSIFNPMETNNNSAIPLNEEDIAIIKEVYRTGYEERLKEAEKQFEYVYKDIRKEEISQRKKSIWWVKNPISILILPTLILLLAFVFLVKKINQSLASKIKKEWLRFGVMASIALLFADVLVVFWISAYDFLTIPDDYSVVPIIRNDTILTTTVFMIFVFLSMFVLRFIELKISKSTQQIFIKTLLIFISTGVLPFFILLLLLFLTITKGLSDDNYYFLSTVFLYLMVFASIRALISYFVFKERSLIVENEKKLSNLRELNAKAELKSLQAQINPHFLYNSLNSIASLAPIDAKKTQAMAHLLSDLFKYSINRKGKKMSTVKDEIDMVKSYLDIEKIRFGERLQFVVEVDSAIENYEIPLFLIQPLVENAVKHGISKHAVNGKIVLKIVAQQNELVITVSDSGPDFPEGLVSGHGLQTVYDLIRLSYEDKASLNWTNSPEKTITITIPKKI